MPFATQNEAETLWEQFQKSDLPETYSLKRFGILIVLNKDNSEDCGFSLSPQGFSSFKSYIEKLS